MTTDDRSRSPSALEEKEERVRRRRRKESYHLVAGHSKLPHDVDDLESDQLYNFLTAAKPKRGVSIDRGGRIQSAKAELVKELAINGGDVTTPTFLAALDELSNVYDPSQFDARIKTRRDDLRNHLGGMWMTLSKPNFPGCIGQNEEGEYMYELGHMSFDMFRPSHLVCSIQGSFNPVHYVGTRQREAIKHVPKTLKDEVKEGNTVLRTYDLVTAFTIEPRDAARRRSDNGREAPSPNDSLERPIKALMTTYGYSLPDPNMPNRLSTWFRGGTIEVWDEEQDMGVWRDIFGNLPPLPLKEKASLFTRKVKTGVAPARCMEADGKLSYSLSKPFGGHGYAYADIVYLDETLRILRGNYGTIYVGARIPFPDE